MTRLMKFIYFLLLIFLVSGCATMNTPNKLGIARSDWDEYSPAKKDQLLLAYEQTQERKKNTQIKPGSGVLSVRISDGKMLLPPFSQMTHYQPILFGLKEGECHKKITVKSNDSSQIGHLEVCYQNNTLYLDPSAYDPQLSLGSLQFPYMSIWNRSFTYPDVTSTGLLKLTGVRVLVHQLVASDNSDD